MDIDPQAFNALDKALTYKIDSYRSDVAPTMIKNVRKIRNGLVSIPVGRFDLIPEGYEIKDKRVLLPVDFPKFGFDLRESQQDVYDAIEDNAIINAFVSWGKTFTALAVAAKLGQKTLVVTHTVSLRTQWEKEIRKVFGIEPGIIGSGKYDISPPIVVGNIQTLYKLRGKIEKEFGTIIIDECHHIPANTFSKLVDASYARYKIGLSGTVQRKDGKHVIMPDYFAHTKFTPPKVLLLSDRVYFLKRVKETLREHCELITGEVPLEEREKKIERVQTGKVDILLGTQSIFSEGISVNPLSCLILATPVSNTPLLTQLVGRVIREYPGKIDPVVVDINLKGKTAEKQAKLRLGHYLQQGYNVLFKDM